MTIDRTPKPCPHKKPHQHGERATFKVCGCRCYPCSNANTRYQQAHDRAKLYGRPTTTWVDAAPVREHVRALSAAGMGRRTIARAAGVPESNIVRLLYGRGATPPTRRCNPGFARKILAIEIPTFGGLADHAVVDSTGASRRLQALVALGYPQAELARRLGVLPSNFTPLVYGRRDILARVHRDVVALYDELSMTPGPAGLSRSRALSHAVKNGWLPPIAWDDDMIDDPEAGPATGGTEDAVDEHAVTLVLDGQPMTLTGRDLEAAALLLIDKGLDYAAIADRCRSDETTVRRVLNTARKRMERSAALDGAA